MTATKHIRLALMNERIDALLYARAVEPDKTPPMILYDTQEGANPIKHTRGYGRRLGVGSVVPGLRLRIGPRTATWYYFEDRQDKRRITKDNPRGRVVISETLGAYDYGVPDGKTRKRAEWHLGTDAARAKASILRGQVAVDGDAPSGKHDAMTFCEALEGRFDQAGNKVAGGYLDKLQARADNNGKRAKWRANVKAISDKHILPRWGNFPLADMSIMRKAVGEWYVALATDTPSTAHHCRQIIRAVYNWARKAGAELPPDNPASRPIDRLPAYRTKAGRKALPRVQLERFPEWLGDWRKIGDPMQRAYWLFLLFTGQRPGEALGTQWDGLDQKHGTLTITDDAKAGNEITIPLSDPIRRVLDLAKDAAADTESELIFHGANDSHWSHRDAPLGVPGHGLRRTYKTVAASLGFPDEMSGRLLGHQPIGVSASYADPLAVQRSVFLSDMQGKVSEAILGLLGSDPTREKFKALPPSPRDVARARGAETYKSDQECPAGHRGMRYTSTNRCVACVSAKNFRQKANRASSRRRKRLERRPEAGLV